MVLIFEAGDRGFDKTTDRMDDERMDFLDPRCYRTRYINNDISHVCKRIGSPAGQCGDLHRAPACSGGGSENIR